MIAVAGSVAIAIESEWPPLQLAGERAGGTAQQGLHAGAQQIRIEGLDHVVISAVIESQHPVVVGVAGGEHQDQRLGAAAGADAAAEGQPVEPGQIEIQQDQVVGPAADQLPGGLAIAGLIADVTPGLQHLAQRTLDQRIVLDHQQLHTASWCGVARRRRLSAGARPEVWPRGPLSGSGSETTICALTRLIPTILLLTISRLVCPDRPSRSRHLIRMPYPRAGHGSGGREGRGCDPQSGAH